MFDVRWISRSALTLGICMALTPAVFSAGPVLESRFFPVFRDMGVTVLRVDEVGVVFDMAFEKVRFCEFIDLVWFHGRVQLELEYRPDAEVPVRPQTRLPGVHRLGPWRVRGVETLADAQAYAIHRCHPLWSTVTHVYGH